MVIKKPIISIVQREFAYCSLLFYYSLQFCVGIFFDFSVGHLNGCWQSSSRTFPCQFNCFTSIQFLVHCIQFLGCWFKLFVIAQTRIAPIVCWAHFLLAQYLFAAINLENVWIVLDCGVFLSKIIGAFCKYPWSWLTYKCQIGFGLEFQAIDSAQHQSEAEC